MLKVKGQLNPKLTVRNPVNSFFQMFTKHSPTNPPKLLINFPSSTVRFFGLRICSKQEDFPFLGGGLFMWSRHVIALGSMKKEYS